MSGNLLQHGSRQLRQALGKAPRQAGLVALQRCLHCPTTTAGWARCPAPAPISSRQLSTPAVSRHTATSSATTNALPEDWEAVIGVETHVQLHSKHKLFSPAPPPLPDSLPNTHVAPFDAALPGSLPRLSSDALELALRACVALDCQIRSRCSFDRKHYFYQDLTPGYQITQKYAPLAKNGKLPLLFADGHLPSKDQEVVVDIEQVQLEQDTAKSTRLVDTHGNERTHVNLDRAGVGLIEIVSGPQMRTPEQAGAYVRKLQTLLRRIKASDGNMDEGSMRCDVNVSLHRKSQPFGTRCEIKNVNSVRFIMTAINSEISRQYAILSEGGRVEQETRGFDEATGRTFALRKKEEAMDYRYMPDPNLPGLRIDESMLASVRESLPELPDARRARLIETYKLPLRDINVLMRIGEDEGVGDGAAGAAGEEELDAVVYFEQLAEGRSAQSAVNWIIFDVMKHLNASGRAFTATAVPRVEHLGELIDLVEGGKVTSTAARSVLPSLTPHTSQILRSSSPTPVLDLLGAQGLLSLSDDSLQQLCAAVVDGMPSEAAAYRAGKKKVVMRLVGEVMKRTKGRADAAAARETLERCLEEGG